ncbi:hypothetical protein F5Y15DRAFT_397464 [Xylariaceae sp. FL0016]|nr:hypothetical protein F5Y15DRAFT_397464 [Xylariaceae sp. FL0016]
MPGAHAAFKCLGPVIWESIAKQDHKAFLADTFCDAQCIIDSIPARPRSATDSDLSVFPDHAPKNTDHTRQLRKEWKEVKLNPRDNPLGLNVYKLGAKDGKGAWFARGSVHEGITFEKWRLGMEREFAESMKVQGKPGDGSIRGIGADKRVVHETVEGCGKMEIYQLSAQFPGPTAPRDFVTLCLGSDSAPVAPTQYSRDGSRSFMFVSKPCVHPECPQRQGIIRGQYESVEFIREIKIGRPPRKARSSTDLFSDDAAAAAKHVVEELGKEAVMRLAHQAAAAPSRGEDQGRPRGRTISHGGVEDNQLKDDDCKTMIEWLMVTRSDPGGNVPRFLIERGTPAGIAGDASKFLNWISSKSLDDFANDDHVDTKLKEDASYAEEKAHEKNLPTAEPTTNLINDTTTRHGSATIQDFDDETPGPSGFYGMIAGALGIVASAAASRIPNPFGSTQGGDTDSDMSSEPSDDSSSIHSFHSFEAAQDDGSSSKSPELENTRTSAPNGGDAAESTHSTESGTLSTRASTQHEKALRKLEERHRKADEKLQRAQERARTKKDNEAQRDEVAAKRLKEKHERDMAKQEERYQQQLRKLEAKQANEQKRAEERKRKQMEREEKASLAMEIEKVRAERDLAMKQLEILRETVGDLQAQNTKLVAQLGREGIPVDAGLGSGAPVLRKAATDLPNGVKS